MTRLDVPVPRGQRRRAAATRPAAVVDRGEAPVAPIRRVLCPIDFSDFSRAAVAEAVGLAQPCDAEVTALFVFPIPSAWRSAGEAPSEPDSAVKSVVAQDLALLLAPARAAGLHVETRIETGDPARRILEAADRTRADVIVMGTHGRSGFERLVLGSVADKVLRKAPCPVLTVSRSRAEASPDAPRVEHGILCAVDLSPASRHTLSFALGLARWTKSPLTLVHVLEGVIAGRGRALLEGEARERLREAVEAAGGAPVAVDPVVAAGKPYREILRIAAERGSGLVVVGIHGRDAEDCMFFGSTADHVVRQAAVPVLTVRDARAVEGDAPARAT